MPVIIGQKTVEKIDAPAELPKRPAQAPPNPSPGRKMTQGDRFQVSKPRAEPKRLGAVAPDGPKKMAPRDSHWNIQIIGAGPYKTLFNASEYIRLKKSICKEGQPLVLIQTNEESGTSNKFILGATQLRLYDEGSIPLQGLLKFDAFIFNDKPALKSQAIPLASLVGNDKKDAVLLDALLGVNARYQQPAPEIYKRQYVIAAMLYEYMLGFCDQSLAEKLIRAIPRKYKQDALNAAMFYCFGEKGSAIAKHLLDWGADPNAVDPDDDISLLGRSMRHFDEPMIRLLLGRGADPYRETDTDVPAVQLVQTERFEKLSPLFAKFMTAP
jgi:hypothetical protein